MEKIKNVLSHGSRKSTDATHERSSWPVDSTQRASPPAAPTGQGSHFASSAGNKNEYHPIYDQMTADAHPVTSSDEPATNSESPPHYSNTTDLKGTSAAVKEDASTASIKSGVIGFPQDGNSHAAMDRSRHQDSTLEAPTSGQDPSQFSRAAGVAGTAGTAGTARQLHHQRDHEDLRASSMQQPFEQSFQQPDIATDTDRAFPLAGGVTSRKQAGDSSLGHNTQSHAPGISEREFGTKDRDAHAGDHQNDETLVGAAALATAVGAHGATRHSGQEREFESEERGRGALSGLSRSAEPSGTADGELLRAGYESPSGNNRGETLGTGNVAGDLTSSTSVPESTSKHDQGTSHNQAALAAATTAAAMHSSGSTQGHEHDGHGHTFSGDPCKANDVPSANVFTSGPHSTDTANMLDPHLHIPGEFPETPAETPMEQTRGPSGYIEHSGQHDFGNPDHLAEHQEEKSHHGRDSAIAGGMGAAGVGAYAASRHHREPTDIGSNPIKSEASPYSSKKLDPRVDLESTKHEEQHLDPTAAPKQSSPRGDGPAVNSQQEYISPAQHHHARDAGLVGAGAGIVGAGAAAHHHSMSQDHQEPQSGPASATIGPHSSNMANILDPRVQPNPELQKHHEARSTAEDPASKTVGPHESNVLNVLDPRVLPQPEKQKGHTTSGPHQSDMLNRLDPHVDSKQYQNTADPGVTGAADLGAYEAARSYDEHRMTGHSASMDSQRYDPTADGAHEPRQAGQHHYGRDAAMVGGIGAAGAGAYMASRQHDVPQQITASQGYPHPTASQGYSQPAIPQGHQTSEFGQPHDQHVAREPGHQRYDSVQYPEDQQHTKRNAAALGAAGAVGAGGAYAYSQRDAEKAEKERLAQQKETEKELEHQRKAQQKELDHQRKEQQKGLDHKLKEQDKAFQKEQYRLEAQHAKDQKHHDDLFATEEPRPLSQEQSRRSYDLDKEDAGKEKKHHLFGFLHRDKDKHNRSAESSPRVSKEYVGAGAGGLAGYDVAQESDSSDGKKHRNRLHKDPPPGHPAREALEHQGVGAEGAWGRV